MRKREILRHYKSSLKKWEEVLIKIKRNENIFYKRYWKTCGFCEVNKAKDRYYVCSGCHLYAKNSKGYRYCYDDNIYGTNVAVSTLRLAGEQEWDKAEKLCKQFIAKIKREIKKAER